MKLTKIKLKQIIREELENILKEGSFEQDLRAPGVGGGVRTTSIVDDFKKALRDGTWSDILRDPNITCEELAALKNSRATNAHRGAMRAFNQALGRANCDNAEKLAYKLGAREKSGRERRGHGAQGGESGYAFEGKKKNK